MSTRTPRRDIALANTLIATAMHLLQSARDLTYFNSDRDFVQRDLMYSEQRLLDAHEAVRAHLKRLNIS